MAEEHGFRSPEDYRLCANNCGFFGSPATLNLCSKCFRDLRLKEHQNALAKAALDGNNNSGSASSSKSSPLSPPPPSSSISPPPIALPDPAALTLTAASSSSSCVIPVLRLPESAGGNGGVSMAGRSSSARPNRCFTCRKRVGLTGFKCRCGSVFCGSHRYAEQHGCTFDYKATGKEEIARANPVVKASKLEKI